MSNPPVGRMSSLNPLIECARCGHRFRVTETRIYDPDNETLCSKCGYHAIGRKGFLEIEKGD